MKAKRLEYTLDAVTGEVLYAEETDLDFYLFTAKGYLFNNNQHAVKLFTSAPWDTLTGDEKQKVMALLPYIDEQNRLMRRDRRNKPMQASHAADALQISPPRAYSFLKRMVAVQLLRKVDGIYYANPAFMVANSRLSKELYTVWRDTLDPALPEWVKEKFREG